MISKIQNGINYLDFKLINLSEKNKVYLLLLVGLFFFFIILKLNIITPFWGDDLEYTYIFSTKEKVTTFSDIIHSQYLHYNLWGGRSVVHTIAQVLLMLPPFAMDLLNSLAYIALTILIYFHIRGNKQRHSISVYCIIHLLLWFFQPAYGESILWITGSANYLWGMLIILLFLLPYRFYEGKRECSILRSTLYSIGMLIAGIIAGWTNENIVVAVILIIILFIATFKVQKNQIPMWSILGLIGTIIGFYIMISAPGNYVRLETATKPIYNLFFFYFKFNMLTARLFSYIGPIFLLTFIMSVLVLKFSDINKESFVTILSIYAIGVFIALYAMIPSPNFPDRAFFGLIVFSVIMVGYSLYNINRNIRFLRYILLGITTMFCIAFVFDFYKSYKEVKQTNVEWNEREKSILNSIAKNEKSIQVYAIKHRGKYALGDGAWSSEILSLYYGTEVNILDY